MVSEKIVEDLQKDRYELLDRKDYDEIEDTSHHRMKIKVNVRKLSNQKRVMKIYLKSIKMIKTNL